MRKLSIKLFPQFGTQPSGLDWMETADAELVVDGARISPQVEAHSARFPLDRPDYSHS